LAIFGRAPALATLALFGVAESRLCGSVHQRVLSARAMSNATYRPSGGPKIVRRSGTMRRYIQCWFMTAPSCEQKSNDGKQIKIVAFRVDAKSPKLSAGADYSRGRAMTNLQAVLASIREEI
jgi:hypothetical protein